MVQTLDRFITRNEGVTEKKEPSPPTIKGRLVFVPEAVTELPKSYFTSIGYDGDRKVCFLRLYEPLSGKLHFWYDKSGHKPYCLSGEPLEKLQERHEVVSNPGFDHLETVQKFDALRNRTVSVTKIVTKDPLTVGGKPTGSIRDAVRCWEADIKYVENYIYDRKLEPGMMYEVKGGEPCKVNYELSEDLRRQVDLLMRNETSEYKALALEWMRLLESEVPTYYRAALDIEVYSPIATRVPDPTVAEYRVTCASILDNQGVKRVLLLRRDGVEPGNSHVPENLQIEFFSGEDELLEALFGYLVKYPFVLTFNGDDFDLKYLYNRAIKLQFPRADIPIELGREAAYLKYGVHLDLYKFFFNRAIQVYAFGQRYREATLDGIGQALLGEGKYEIDAPVSELTYRELAAYCFRDAEIVMNLTTFEDELIMKLITAISRITHMALDDVTRQGVSTWIRSILHHEHRSRNWIIPRQDEIIEIKGSTTTEAVIKGKKYKGAFVIEPKPGIHFNVAVLDFASLYPSIIKVWNLGYQTIRCDHDECRVNVIPGTPHWVCRERRALESLLIGSLRDLRVNWYKPKSKGADIHSSQAAWYKVVSDALKVVLNASYGVFGAEKFALYCPPVAEATAAIGRFVITETVQKAKELGLEVFYGDTDSIFLGGQNRDLLNQLIEWSKSNLRMELEVEKDYRYLALSSRKKNYLGVLPDGRVDIKGLTGKKRHIPVFLQRVFYEMISTISDVKSPDEFEDARKRITDTVRACCTKLRNREYQLDDLSFSVMISKPPDHYVKTTPQHVKAAQLLSGKGFEVKAGDIIAFVKVISEPGVKPVQLATIQEIDVDKYMEYFRSTFEQVLDSLGAEFDELIGVKKLESFF